MSSEPSILTTTVGSYPIPEWLAALPSEQARLDATRVVFDIQRQAGIDLPTDGELYRFDVNHPDTNGMIEYFIHPMAGMRAQVGRSDHEAFARMNTMRFRRKAAGVVEEPLGEGSLDLLADCELAASVADGPFKFTVTSPYMLARTLLDRHYDCGLGLPPFEDRWSSCHGVLSAYQPASAKLQQPPGGYVFSALCASLSASFRSRAALQLEILGGRALDAQRIQIPLRIRILREPFVPVHLPELARRRRPGGNGIQPPVNENAEPRGPEPGRRFVR